MSHKALSGHKAVASGGTVTSAAGWGKIENFQFGVGWRRSDKLKLFEPKPLGMILKNVQQLGIGYGQGAGLLANGKVQVWGLNNGNTLPWTVGPEGAWTGLWQYRTNLLEQTDLEPEFSRAQIEEKERKLEFTERSDGRKGLEGQVVYIKGHIVAYEGKSWEAQKENCGIVPGTDESTWKLTSPQINEFEKPIGEGEEKVWYPNVYNLATPLTGSQIKNVSAIALIAAKGIALLKNGEVREWGRITGYGAGGVNFNGSYGKTPRPLKTAPKKVHKFKGRLTEGSPWIDALESVGEKHHKVKGIGLSYGKATRNGSTIKTPELVTGVLPETVVISNSETEQIAVEGEVIAKLASTLSTASTVAFLSLEELTKTIKAADSVFLNDGAGHTQTFIATTEAKSGEGVVFVEAQKPTFAFPAKTTKVAKGTPFSPERRKVNRIELAGGANGALSAALTTVGTTALLHVKEVTAVIKAGEKFFLHDGSIHVQAWTASAEAKEGATTISVTAQKAEVAFPATQTKVLKTLLPLKGYQGELLHKKPPKEQVFWNVAEAAAQSAGWPMTPTLPEGVKVQAVAIGTNGGAFPFSLALTEAGEVLTWGSNSSGQQGLGDTTLKVGKENFQAKPAFVRNPTNTGNLKEIVAIACGERFNCALSSDHKVYVWGFTESGLGGKVLDEEGEKAVNLPVIVPNFPSSEGERPIAIAAAEKTAWAKLENGKLYAWGGNSLGECGNGEVGGNQNARWKTGHAYAANNKSYDRGFNYTCILAVTSATHPASDSTGPAYSAENTYAPGAIVKSGGKIYKSIKPGNTAHTPASSAEWWEELTVTPHWEQTGHPNQPVPEEVSGITGKVTYMAGGRNHACAVTEAGLVYTWGTNEFGQIGNGLTGFKGSEPEDPPHGVPFHVPLESKKALSCDCGEWDTLVILEGSESIANPLRVKLKPKGEVAGEQSANLILEMHTSIGTTGWELKYGRSPSKFEEIELQLSLEELEVELEELVEEGAPKEEKEEVEEEIEEIEEVRAEFEKTGTKIAITPTEVSAGVLRYEWVPPSPMTPNLGFNVELKRAASEPTNWRSVNIPTESLFGSPYS